jgi:hypothetical protein
MTTKVFEVRDRATCMVVLAQKFEAMSPREVNLLARAGYGTTRMNQGTYVSLVPIDGGHGAWTSDPYDHGRARTLGVIHQHLLEHWSDYPSGALLDVEFLLGETAAPKVSEIEIA